LADGAGDIGEGVGHVDERRQDFSKATPNPPKSSQARPSLTKLLQEKKLGFAWICLAEMSLFNSLRRLQGVFFFFGRLSRIKTMSLAYNAPARLFPASGVVAEGGGAIIFITLPRISVFRKNLSTF
jgi:hypothetical protein